MPVTVKRYLQGSQLLGNLLSVSGVSSCPTLSQSRRRPPPVRWRNAPPARKGIRGRRGGVRRFDGGSRARVRPIRESSGRCGRARTPARESDTVREAGRVARRRTAPALAEPVDARRGVGIRAQPDRARHGTRRGRAVLQRLRTVVRGRRDSARQDDALRRTPEQTGSSELGRRRGWRRPGPPGVHDPRRARRGAHPSRRLSSTGSRPGTPRGP